jgi:hypothetical protein
VISRTGDLSQSYGYRKENMDAFSVAINLSPFFVEYPSGLQTMTVSVSSLNGSWLVVSCCTIYITNAFLKDIRTFCILLQKLNESGLSLISDNNDEPACYKLIDSNWHTMQQEKRIAFPKLPGTS